MTNQDIIRFLRHTRQGPKGIMEAIAQLAGTKGSTLRAIANGRSRLGDFVRSKMLHLIPMLQSGRIQFERDTNGAKWPYHSKTRLKAVIRELPVEEKLHLDYPAQFMRSLARKNDLPDMGLLGLRHRVHNLGRRTDVPQVPGPSALGAVSRAWRHP